MNLTAFLKEKQLSVLFHLLSLFIISCILYLYNENGSLVIVINLISLFFFFIPLGVEYYQLKNYYDEIKIISKQIKEKTYIADIIEEPHFFSGKLFYNFLKEATKDMNDCIFSLKNSQRDYNDYIELWVHEIKTPITALKLILSNHKTTENIPIQEEILKIEGYVEQTLYFARSSTLNQDYRIETFTLETVVDLAIKSLSLSIIRANGNVHKDNLDLKVTSDSKWIVFILKQLIDNAIKYRHNSLKISFIAKKVENGTLLLISDNGIGIAAADIERIFNRGFTGTNGRNYVKSTGMGLYLCKTLSQKLGLQIGVDSQENIGTTLKLYFPDKLRIFQ
ncbi:sensor histidine kinase [Lysinibacillus sp. NPDC094403]|uniref:sensor histidine kinase n=1 Tax=Lysinibacillus sp. NPDC094403 TaxID=3390581 RepID=UPI003CFC6BC1